MQDHNTKISLDGLRKVLEQLDALEVLSRKTAAAARALLVAEKIEPRLPPPPPPLAINVKNFPISAEFILERFPTTDDVLIRKLVALSREALSAAGTDPDEVTDLTLSTALKECTKPTQRSAALYLSTVPMWMRRHA